MHLTDISIRRLKLEEKQKIYFDDSLPGFGVRVSKKHKTFVCIYGPKRRYKSLGKYPSVSLQDARRDAKILLAVQPASSGLVRYSAAVSSFLKDAKLHIRPETQRQYERHLNAFGSAKRIGEITRTEIRDHLDTYSDRPFAYHHALAALRAFFAWCVRQELVDRNPVAGERQISTPSRERVLTLDELRTIYAYDYPNYCYILRLCILTGQRRTEIASIQPEWIDGDRITFPGSITKNKRDHTIPLTDTTKALAAHAPFGKDGAFNGWSNATRRLKKHVEIQDWRPHDLRRSFSTHCAAIGVPISIVERILNHSVGTVTPLAKVYNRYDYHAEVKEALETYEKLILQS